MSTRAVALNRTSTRTASGCDFHRMLAAFVSTEQSMMWKDDVGNDDGRIG
jgi:hypothetical protein